MIPLHDSRDFNSTTLRDVHNIAIEIERHLSTRGLLRNMRRLLPLFEGLEHLSKILDRPCNGTPFLPWLWAPIGLILRITSKYIEAFEKVLEAYSKMASRLQPLAVISNALKVDLDCQEFISIVYADILEIHEEMYKMFRGIAWKERFFISWHSFQKRFDTITGDITNQIDLLNKRMVVETKEVRQDLDEAKFATVSGSDEQQSAELHQSIMSWLAMIGLPKMRIIGSISAEGEKYSGTSS
ncbi:hypothetical protein V8C40DRAFT_238034 [Trichoderma camerunense]